LTDYCAFEPSGLQHELPKASVLIPLQNSRELQIDLIDELPSLLGVLGVDKLGIPQKTERFVYLADRLLQGLDLPLPQVEFLTNDGRPQEHQERVGNSIRLGEFRRGWHVAISIPQVLCRPTVGREPH
jgi:hypothetical protein